MTGHGSEDALLAGASRLALARTVARRCRRAVGVAGVDPASSLVTSGRRGTVRGVSVRQDPDDAAAVRVAADLVGLTGARLPDAGARVRDEIAHVCMDHGVALAGVEARFTDLSDEPLPAPPAEPAAVLPAPPPPAPVASPPPPPAAAPPARPAPRRPAHDDEVRVPLAPASGGRRSVLVIRVEVVEEDGS